MGKLLLYVFSFSMVLGQNKRPVNEHVKFSLFHSCLYFVTSLFHQEKKNRDFDQRSNVKDALVPPGTVHRSVCHVVQHMVPPHVFTLL